MAIIQRMGIFKYQNTNTQQEAGLNQMKGKQHDEGSEKAVEVFTVFHDCSLAVCYV